MNMGCHGRLRFCPSKSPRFPALIPVFFPVMPKCGRRGLASSTPTFFAISQVSPARQLGYPEPP